jgi:predicted kinase
MSSKMRTIFLMKGIPACGKSFFAKELIRKEPGKWKRINFDDLRGSIDGGVYSPANEKIITKMRDMLIVEALKNDQNVIIDNTHIKDKGRHFDNICKVARGLNIDVQIIEKPIYCEINTALERDDARENKVGKNIIEGFWKASGGKQFAHYVPKVETFFSEVKTEEFKTIDQDEKLPRCCVFDNDGTISLIHRDRNPYDASTADLDAPHIHVIECMRLYHNAGYKILFVSGREEKDRAPTERFYQKHFPEVKYELFMRPTGSKEKDVVIKERIYNEHIKGKYYIAGWYDDRISIVRWLYQTGFPVFRVNDPDAIF